MDSSIERVKEVLRSFISPIIAESMVKRSATRAGVNIRVLRNGDGSKLLHELEMGIKLYVPSKAQQVVCLRKLRDILFTDEKCAFSNVKPSLHTVATDDDLVNVRNKARQLAHDLGFPASMQSRIATAVSELARNILQYAGKGEISLMSVKKASRRGMEVIASDEGPGIDNLGEIFAGRYKSKTGMGLGLMGTKVLVDEFNIDTAPGQGTKVTIRTFLRHTN